MTLLDSLFRRDAGARPVGTGAGEMTGEQAQEARTKARRRLIGAVVLLGIGVIAFPLLFETQPRPIPVDIPIVIPPRDGAPPLALPAVRASGKPAASAPSSAAAPATTVVAAPTAVASAPVPAAATPAPAAAPPRPEPVAAKPEPPKSEPPKAEPPRPEPSKPAPKPTPKEPEPAPKAAAAAPAASSTRFVVQLGAFAEAAAVRDTRAKAQKAGVSTYTQVVETSGGKRTRVRVGPFNSREDAEKAADKIKAAGLTGAVMPL